MGLDFGLDSRLESLQVLIALQNGLGGGVGLGGLIVFLAIALIRGHVLGLIKGSIGLGLNCFIS